MDMELLAGRLSEEQSSDLLMHLLLVMTDDAAMTVVAEWANRNTILRDELVARLDPDSLD